jgi:cytochrome b561
VALLIIVNVGLAWSWDYVSKQSAGPLFQNHKAIGLTVLGLAILRLLWRLSHTPPAFPRDYAQWEKTLAHVVHWGLYVVMFGLPLSGWLMVSAAKEFHPTIYFGMFQIPPIGWIAGLDPASKASMHELFEGMHGVLAKFLYLLFFLHVAGALKHQLIDKQSEIQRMLP